jgi:hypothetical protein
MRTLLVVLSLFFTIGSASAQHDGEHRINHRARLTTTDGPAREKVMLLAADSVGIWVAPQRKGRTVEVAALRGQARFVPVMQLQDLSIRSRNGVLVGFVGGGVVGYIVGAEVGKAINKDDSSSTAGVAGGIVGVMVLAPVGAVAGLFPARFPIGGSMDAYERKLAVLRQRAVFKEGLPNALRK